jgi:hypothetical protein
MHGNNFSLAGDLFPQHQEAISLIIEKFKLDPKTLRRGALADQMLGNLRFRPTELIPQHFAALHKAQPPRPKKSPQVLYLSPV